MTLTLVLILSISYYPAQFLLSIVFQVNEIISTRHTVELAQVCRLKSRVYNSIFHGKHYFLRL